MDSAPAKPGLMFLCHRIPYPPNKGDKIRSFHLFQYLRKRFNVHLAAFIDTTEDWQYRDRIGSACASRFFVPLDPFRARLRSVKGLVTGEPLTLRYYDSPDMAKWVRHTWQSRKIDYILVYSSAMAKFVRGEEFAGARRLVDFVDVDSDKWRQYAAARHWPGSWIYGREAATLETFEHDIAREFDVSVFVSAKEAELFSSRLQDPAVRVTYMDNGVDTVYFSPDPGRESPFPRNRKAVVFTGAMDYWANIDAVTWFTREVLPKIRRKMPNAIFYIVGINPAESVRMLAGDGVVVTGAVVDVRPYLQHASLVIAPLRIARGVQNKVLEAMAMAKPVVLTSQGLEGIDAIDGKEVLVADGAQAFADKACQVLDASVDPLGPVAREKVCQAYGWEANLQRFSQFLIGRAPL